MKLVTHQNIIHYLIHPTVYWRIQPFPQISRNWEMQWDRQTDSTHVINKQFFTFCKDQQYVHLYAVDTVGIYFASLDIYYILSKENYMEQLNTKLTANWGKTLLLVQCWLTKNTDPAYANNEHDHNVKRKLYLVSSAVAVHRNHKESTATNTDNANEK